MMKWAVFTCLAAVAPSFVMAAARKDSLPQIPGHLMEEVVVTGTRSASDVRHLSQTVSIVDREAIDGSMEQSLLPVLTEHVPGLFTTSRGVMGYGVSGGAAGGISLRGLSGGSGQLMVLIDGHPQYMGLMGHPIADAYQSYMADRVEVLRGPASMLYGSNAMGGVVNIVTRRMAEDGMKTDFRAGYGSYNTVETDLVNSFKKGRFSLSVGGSYDRTDGHRVDMKFEQYGGFARAGYEISDNWRVNADVNVTHFNASQPGSVLQPLVDADQSITRGVASLVVENRYDVTEGAVSLYYNWGDHWINDGYTPNPDDNNSPKDYRFDSHDDMLGVSWYQSARLFGGNRLTAGIDYLHFGGSARNRYVTGSRIGESEQLVDKSMDEIAGYVDLRQDIGRRLTVNAGVRVDHHSSMGVEWIPQFGLSVHLPKTSELKLSVGKGFRYPTIREMYMFPPRNPNLEPESLWNYEIAFTQRPVNGLSYGINLFYLDGKNLIMTVPNPNGSGRLNLNTGKVDNCGVELQGAYRIDRVWTANANYSFLHMKNPVLAAPEHKLYVGVDFVKDRWTASTGVQYIAGLYTSTSPEVTENFVLWNLRVQYKVTHWLGLWARGENLLAWKYEINAGYPMPRATVMAGIEVKL